MKSAIVAASAAVIGAASAGHAGFHHRRHFLSTGVPAQEVCTTYTSTWYGQPGLVPEPTYAANSTLAVTPTLAVTAVPVSSTVALPTAEVTTCPTPGTYTFPAKTIVVTETTTVCGATTTAVPSGTHTIGGVTTSVVTATTIVCPYATVETSGSVSTSVIKTTTFVCPSGGEYTIAPTTTVCTDSETIVYPTVTSLVPGTYTKPETTVTIVKTSEVYVCPYETSKAAQPTSQAQAPSAPAQVSAPVVSAPAVSKPAYSAPASSVVAPVSSIAVAASSSAAKPSASSSYTGGKIPTNGNQWAMTYTPYTGDSSASCKTKDEVDADIKKIHEAGFTSVRTYSTDCSGLENIGAACEKYGMKMIIGVFIESSGISGAQEQVAAIKAWAKWELVVMVVIGNEAVFNQYCSASELAAFITETKQELVGAGCPSSIPFTTTEPLNILQEVGSTFCSAIDVVGVNIQSFFTSSVSASTAGSFVKTELAEAAKICSGKDVYNLESGWPSSGSSNGAAIPGASEQLEAITSIIQEAGEHSVIFSFQNDLWKSEGSLGVEQSWGCVEHFLENL